MILRQVCRFAFVGLIAAVTAAPASARIVAFEISGVSQGGAGTPFSGSSAVNISIDTENPERSLATLYLQPYDSWAAPIEWVMDLWLDTRGFVGSGCGIYTHLSCNFYATLLEYDWYDWEYENKLTRMNQDDLNVLDMEAYYAGVFNKYFEFYFTINDGETLLYRNFAGMLGYDFGPTQAWAAEPRNLAPLPVPLPATGWLALVGLSALRWARGWASRAPAAATG